MERRNSQGLDKVIHVYPTNLALQRFDKVKIIQIKFFQGRQDESEHFGEIFNKIPDGIKR